MNKEKDPLPASEYKWEWPHITDETRTAILETLDQDGVSIYDHSGVFERFEEEFAQFLKIKHTLLFSSGTASLHAAMVGCDFGPEDEVICPSYTFYATVTPIFQTGAIPVLCDAKPNGNIDPNKIEALITPKTKAVIVTHMWGQLCDMDEITAICRKYNLKLIEDCAHAHGAIYKGKLAGTFGDVAAFSLQGKKIITGGEGGVLATKNDEIFYRALMLGHYNKRCFQQIPKDSPYHKYAMTGMGLKLRAHPLAIAMAEEQFSHLSEWHRIMNENAQIFIDAIRGIPHITVPSPIPDIEPSWYALTIQVDTQALGITTEELCKELIAEGISGVDAPNSTCPLNFLPLFQDPGFLFRRYQGKVSYKPGDFPVAEWFFANTIKFPIDVYETGEYRETLKRNAKILNTVIQRHGK